jgi:tRNA pseudouridine55 synthase
MRGVNVPSLGDLGASLCRHRNAVTDGVLVVDKPAGLTSHDVVAAARRALRERRIGHTGTLDPMATGVLPLACGRATRLVRFLTASDKDYDATVVFGRTTDTCDTTGTETSRSDLRPDAAAVERAVASLTGSYLQLPPAYSAKKVGGQRAHALARRGEAVELTPVPVTVSRAMVLGFDGESARIALTCSPGFYVRSFAVSLGELVGTGACLGSLRRTRSGEFTVAEAMPLAQVIGAAADAVGGLLPVDRLLPHFPVVRLSDEERVRVRHGQDVSAAIQPSGGAGDNGGWVRLIDGEGHLLALAVPGPRPGSLHPAVVLI